MKSLCRGSYRLSSRVITQGLGGGGVITRGLGGYNTGFTITDRLLPSHSTHSLTFDFYSLRPVIFKAINFDHIPEMSVVHLICVN